MNRLLLLLLLVTGLWFGSVAPVQAQRGYRRGYYRRPPVYRPRYYGPRYYAPPRYYHAPPYRSYYGRSYYRPRPYYRRPGPAVIIRP